MKSKKIYIVRHGQTDYNLQGIVQGSKVNAPLNSKGKAQAQAFYEAYQSIPFQKIYISELNRTRESVLGFINKGIPVEVTPFVNEISWGIYDGKINTKEVDSIYWRTLDSWKSGQLDVCVEEAETPIQVQQRLKKFLEQVLSRSEDLILVCMHGRAMRILLSLIEGKALKDMDSYQHSNLCLYVVEMGEQKGEIVLENDTKHLLTL